MHGQKGCAANQEVRPDRDASLVQPTIQPPLPSVTVAVPTRNRGNLITETLHSLIALSYPGLDILIVDQSTNRDTQKAVAAVVGGDPRVRLARTDTVGSSAARNLAATLSAADIVAYTDDDCIVSAYWLQAITAEFNDPGIAAVYGRLLPHNAVRRTGTEVGFKPATERAEYAERTPPWYIGHGGNMSFRRQILLEAGGFDPLLGAGGTFGACEDHDIAYRLLAAGERIAYTPDALAYHKHWKDWPAQCRMERCYGVGAGAQFSKYIRCGDRYGWRLLATRVWQLGMRRIGAGIFKWRSWRVVQLGCFQLIYPWVGVWRSRRHAIDHRSATYVG